MISGNFITTKDGLLLEKNHYSKSNKKNKYGRTKDYYKNLEKYKQQLNNKKMSDRE